MHNTRSSSLNLCQWNANGITNKKEELLHFLEEHRIDVLLLSETHLKPSLQLKFRNYNVIRNDRPGRNGGGTAMLIKKNISYEELPTTQNVNLEITGAKITTAEGPINVYSAYLPPSSKAEFNEIQPLVHPTRPTIIAGDFNAKHTDWNSKTINDIGRNLKTIAEELDLHIYGPDQDTHIHSPTNATDVLDIIIHKNLKWNFTAQVHTELSSDHLPIITEIHARTEDKNEEIRTINWLKYRRLLKINNTPITTREDIENEIAQLQNAISEATAEATTTQPRKTCQKPLPPAIKDIIKAKNKAKKRYMRTFHPQDKTNLNYLTNEVKRLLQDYRNEQWNTFLTTLETEDQSLWNTTRALTKGAKRKNIPPVTDGNTTAVSDKQKAEMFANSLTKQFQLNNIKNRRIEEEVENSIYVFNLPTTDEEEEEIENVTTEDITKIISQLRKKKAPGIDGITNMALKFLTEEGHSRIADITNAIYKLRYFPQIWKTSQIVMIKKPQKPDKDVSSYRPISLLPTISKIVERTIHDRLVKQIEDKNIIPNFQFGFRRKHATTHQLIRITEDIIENFNRSTQTAAIYMDIEKAFDRVWHDGLIHKLRRLQLPTWLTKIIDTYLRNRKFQVKINEEMSETKNIEAGVPQGSILGPTLYNIYTSDIPKLYNSKIAQYADDTVIYTHNRIKTALTRKLQEDLDIFMRWAHKWKIKINENKTIAVHFIKKARQTPPPPLKINNKEIEWKSDAKYLGVTMDSGMTYGKHIMETKNKIRQLRGRLYPLLNRNSQLNLQNKTTIIKMVVIPVITYGSEAWAIASTTRKNVLQRELNVLIRRAANAPWYITNEQIREELKMDTLENIIHKRRGNTKQKMKEHENITIRNATTTARKRKMNTHKGVLETHEEEEDVKRRKTE